MSWLAMIICVAQSWVFLVGGLVECLLNKHPERVNTILDQIGQGSLLFRMPLHIHLYDSFRADNRKELIERVSWSSCLRGRFVVVFSIVLQVAGLLVLAHTVHIAKRQDEIIVRSLFLCIAIACTLRTIYSICRVRKIKLMLS